MSIPVAVQTILDDAFAAVAEQGKDLSDVYLQRLDDYRAHAAALVDDLASGKVTLDEARKAAEQEKNAVVSTLVTGGYDAVKATQAAAMDVLLVVLKAGLAAVAA